MQKLQSIHAHPDLKAAKERLEAARQGRDDAAAELNRISARIAEIEKKERNALATTEEVDEAIQLKNTIPDAQDRQRVASAEFAAAQRAHDRTRQAVIKELQQSPEVTKAIQQCRRKVAHALDKLLEANREAAALDDELRKARIFEFGTGGFSGRHLGLGLMSLGGLSGVNRTLEEWRKENLTD